ncbi:MAG: peptide-methionine (S)-S-oxide reductase MsrA, partial [Firmicutes bacterium]|nr:peptide-methionine (S)-S-oxide reductase MsrA [Bacillota bacterium]
QVTFDAAKISYAQLLDIFWKQIDPTDAQGQFCDQGSSYRTAIFYHTPEQKALAEASKKQLQASGRFALPIVTEILPAQAFYPAEAYHQNFYQTHADHYQAYRKGSGRDQFLQIVWQKPE